MLKEFIDSIVFVYPLNTFYNAFVLSDTDNFVSVESQGNF